MSTEQTAVDFSDPNDIPVRVRLRDEWGSYQYTILVTAGRLGFLAPRWNCLPEEVRESYRAYAVDRGVGLLAELMREYGTDRLAPASARRDGEGK